MQLVLHVVGDDSAMISRVVDLLVKPESQYVLTALELDSDTFERTSASLEEVIARVQSGSLANATVHFKAGLIRYTLMARPSTCGVNLSKYLCQIEYLDRNVWPLWKALLEIREAIVASLGFEEGVEWTDEMLSPESFPWAEWPLVIGAIRDGSSGGWIVREGPEMSNFK